MKWFFCWCQDTNFRSDHNWTDLIRVSVESALRNTSLEPHFVYDGEPSPFTEELAAKGVKVIFHRLSFTSAIVAHQPADPNYQAIARGAFLRFDIPLLADHDDDFVLYTDADVMFMHDEPLTGYRPNPSLTVKSRSFRPSNHKPLFAADRFPTPTGYTKGVMLNNRL